MLVRDIGGKGQYVNSVGYGRRGHREYMRRNQRAVAVTHVVDESGHQFIVENLFVQVTAARS